MTMLKPYDVLIECLERHLADPGLFEIAEAQFKNIIPDQVASWIGIVLSTRNLSYRDALLIQLAYRDTIRDLTIRPKGARSVAKNLGEFFEGAHIQGVKDAYQNIGKNSSTLVRGNFEPFDSFLKWASDNEASKESLDVTFEYACGYVASTSRPVSTFPKLDKTKLSFARVMLLFDLLFDTGSQGAYEQFSIAALLDALIEQFEAKNFRVETKNLNASDKSSSAAGDIQVFSTGKILHDAYEITANDWSQKVHGITKTIKEFDLSRMHVIAKVGSDENRRAALNQLKDLEDDISVLDVRSFAASLISILRKSGRAAAMKRLYEFLDQYQSDISKTNFYVATLSDMGLVQDPTVD